MTIPVGTASPSIALAQGNDIARSVTSAVNSNTFIFFAAFDGTDNGSDPTVDGSGDTQATAIAQLFHQVLPTGVPTGNIGGDYEPGVGTPDTILGSSGFNVNALNAQVLAAAQKAYLQFARQANDWLGDHPNGSITSMITAFSRGGASAAIFSQMLYEYGLVYGPLDSNGVPQGKMLIPPGTVGAVSAALILDPVLTEVSGNMDFPPTVQNLTVVRAANEYRDLFTAPTYTGDADDIVTVQGNHGDVGDLYDTAPNSGVTSPLGGIYLDSYTQFFKNAGLTSIGAVPSALQYNPKSGNPILIHSESQSASQILASGDFWDANYNSDNDLSVTRETNSYGSPVAVSGSATSFTDYNGNLILGGTGGSSSTSGTFVILPNAQAIISSFSDTIAVGGNASLTFNSDSLVSGTTNTLQGSPNTVVLGNNATFTLNGWNTNITGSNDTIILAAGDNDVTINGTHDNIILGLGASITDVTGTNFYTDTITENTTGGTPFVIGAGTVTYSSSTITNSGTQTLEMVADDPIDLGALNFDTTADTDSVTFADGENITLPGISGSIDVKAASTGTDPSNTLVDYLSDLGDSTSAPDLSIANNSYYNPSGTAYGVSGVVVANPGNTSATEYFAPGNTPGATLTGVDEADILVGGVEVEVPTSDVLETDVLGTPNVTDIASDTLDDVKTLDLGGPLTLTVGQFNAFDSIEGFGTDSLVIATDGMGSALTNVVDISNCSQDAPNVTAAINTISVQGWDGVTVVGNNTDGQTLIASLYGDDTLEAGDGAADTLYAGEGVDTLVGGTGGDSFVAVVGTIGIVPVPLAAGSVIQGQGTGNSLTVAGDITGVAITDIQTLITGGDSSSSITLTNAQWNGFDELQAFSDGGFPGFTINAANDNEIHVLCLRLAA